VVSKKKEKEQFGVGWFRPLFFSSLLIKPSRFDVTFKLFNLTKIDKD